MTGKEKATTIGAGTGAVAGAVVGGPVGAVIGAGVGAYVGHEGTNANGKVTNTGTSHDSKMGWNHDDVSRAQTALNDKGYNVTVDGRYGPNTAAAVRNFQSDNGLAANGTLDDATLKALGVRG
ncbi:MAG: peptidoglycan-binding protein [Proteobacteria bacterium]|nr:peptidoglycan-binding protein [Pseudomonadota bacterium]